MEGLLQVPNQCVLVLSLDHDVIDVFLDIAAHLRSQACAHGTLECWPRILEAERHAGVIVATIRCDKICFLLVFDRHLELVVTRECIQETQEVTASSGVHNRINPRHRKWVLRAGPVQISEVDAEPLLVGAGLGHHHGVRLPSGMWYSSNHIGLLEFFHF